MLAALVPKEMQESRETLAYPVHLGQRVTLAPLAPQALPELKAMLAAKVILELPELPERPVRLELPDQLGPLALLVLTVRPRLLVVAC